MSRAAAYFCALQALAALGMGLFLVGAIAGNQWAQDVGAWMTAPATAAWAVLLAMVAAGGVARAVAWLIAAARRHSR